MAGGDTLSNFAITPVTGSWSITTAPVTAKAGSYSGTFNGWSHVVPCTLTGAYVGDLVCTDTPPSVGPGIGSGTVTPSVSAPDLSDFSITPVNGAWSIIADALAGGKIADQVDKVVLVANRNCLDLQNDVIGLQPRGRRRGLGINLLDHGALHLFQPR